MVLNRKAKGDLGELRIAADLVSKGYKVAFPYGEDWDYDLIVCRAGGMERVQVKYARSDGEIVVVRAGSHSLTNGKVRETKHYTAEMIDWLAVWDATTDRCFYIPASELGLGMSMISLRLTPAKNGQVLRIRHAGAYEKI